MSEDWQKDPRFRVIEKPKDKAKRRWDELGWMDQNDYGSFEKFYKSNDWLTEADKDLIIHSPTIKRNKTNKSKSKRKKTKQKSKNKTIKKKSKKPKTRPLIRIYGQEYDEEFYIKNWIPEVEQILKNNKANTELANYPVKLFKKNKGKYWNSDPIYPRSKNEFIHKFFEKKQPRGLEGIWNLTSWGTVGIVRERSFYQVYDINITIKNPWKLQKGAVESFFDGLFGEDSNTQNIDYHYCNGTKGGALIPTSKKNKFTYVSKGVYIVPSEDGQFGFAHEEQKQVAHVINNNLITSRRNFGDSEEKFSRVWPEYSIDEETIPPTSQQNSSAGTGFFIDNQGHIVTNNHVVSPCNGKQKVFYKNKEIKAKLIAKDEQLDLALLKIDVKNQNYIKISNKPIKKLQHIIAAGYPGGKALSDDLKFTSGIISSLKGFKDNSSQIQIDAALNMGNSGGPIVDSKNGELVAVAVSMLRNEIVEGINFGIKVSQVRDFLYSNKIDTDKIAKKHKDKNISKILESSTLYIFCN